MTCSIIKKSNNVYERNKRKAVERMREDDGFKRTALCLYVG